MRCLTLADHLQDEGCRVHFVCRPLVGHMAEFIRAKGYQVDLLDLSEKHHNRSSTGPDAEVSWENDFRQTSIVIDAILQRSSARKLKLLVVDHYRLDSRWETEVAGYTEKLLVIDDLANREHRCNYLLDQTYGRRVDAYQALVNEDCELFLGTQYALLRAEFCSARAASIQRRRDMTRPERILISMGGTDPVNATGQLLRSLSANRYFAKMCFEVVLGVKAPYLEKVRAQIEQSPLDITLLVDVADMALLMSKADIAIGAAGSSTWERCCLGLPALIVSIADNQATIAQALVLSGAVERLALDDIGDSRLLEKCIRTLLDDYSLRVMVNAAICDGIGAVRMVRQLLPLQSKDGQPVTLRRLGSEDSERIFGWQQTPQTRRFSRNPIAPTWEEHQRWFERRLRQPECAMSMIMLAGRPSGVIRLEPVKHDIASHEVSIFLAPECYGRGVGKAALALLHEQHPRLTILATVFAENTASRMLFLQAGYIQTEDNQFISRVRVGS